MDIREPLGRLTFWNQQNSHIFFLGCIAGVSEKIPQVIHFNRDFHGVSMINPPFFGVFPRYFRKPPSGTTGLGACTLRPIAQQCLSLSKQLTCFYYEKLEDEFPFVTIIITYYYYYYCYHCYYHHHHHHHHHHYYYYTYNSNNLKKLSRSRQAGVDVAQSGERRSSSQKNNPFD